MQINYEKMLTYYKKQLHKYRLSLCKAIDNHAPAQDTANISDKIKITADTIKLVEGNNARRA